ncbi:MAG TPA: cytochrome P450 [Acidimicrobiales bacterium]|nr:cytochrome P450 [Acidimicrobiales bacterium]
MHTDEELQAMTEGARLMANEPQTIYRTMREIMPAVEFVDSPAGKMGIICHRRDIEEAFRHPEIFASTEAVDLSNVRPLIPLSIDPPDHKKYRKILDPLFAPRAMAALEQPVAELADKLMDAFEGEEEIEFGAAFSVPLPSQVFLTLLGLPLEELPAFLAMKDGIIRPERVVGVPSGHPDAKAHQVKTAQSIYDYFEKVLDERSRDPKDDLVTGFLNTEIEGDRLTREEILDISFLFLIAGLDTVTASLDCMFSFLARHPEHRRQIVENPALIPAAVEELLRYETPVIGVPRKALQDTELGGCPIKAGDQVTVLLGSGNTDDTEFGDGDVVRFDRDPNRHMAFGGGIHRCLGSHLARQELRVALREWHKRYPDYHVKPGVTLDYTSGIRSIDHFPLVLGPET